MPQLHAQKDLKSVIMLVFVMNAVGLFILELGILMVKSCATPEWSGLKIPFVFQMFLIQISWLDLNSRQACLVLKSWP